MYSHTSSCARIPTHTHTQRHKHMKVHTHIHTHAFMQKHPQRHTHMDTPGCTPLSPCTYADKHTCVRSNGAHVQACTCTGAHIWTRECTLAHTHPSACIQCAVAYAHTRTHILVWSYMKSDVQEKEYTDDRLGELLGTNNLRCSSWNLVFDGDLGEGHAWASWLTGWY